jgi:AraC family transcriptional regulator
MATRADIAARLDVPGVSVQIRDYLWHAGENVSTYEHDFVVSYRPYPTQISVAARLPKGALQNFGQLMFFPADLEVEAGTANNNERVRNIWCRFDPDWFRRIWQSVPSWDGNDLARCFDMRNVRIEQALQRMGAEVVNPGFASSLFVESLSTVVAIEIARYFGDTGSQFRVRTREGKLSQSDFSRIVEYIESAENRCPSMEEIANVCDISPAHLRRSFKRTTGKTVHEYVEAIRLKKAQALLADTDLPLKEISYRLGFANSTTFSTTFKRLADETPSGYRYRLRGMLN